jgi:ribose transport system permease protein
MRARDSVAAKTSVHKRSVGQLIRSSAARFGLVVLLGGMVLLFSLLPASRGTFASVANFQNLLASQSVLIVVSLAFLIPVLAGEFDLSVGLLTGATAVLTAGLISGAAVPLTGGHRIATPLAVGIGIAFGTAVGVVNSIIVTRLQVPSIISGLGLTIVLEGLVSWYSGGVSIVSNIPANVKSFGSARSFAIPPLFLVATAVTSVAWFVTERTVLGKRLDAVGSNRTAARLVGVNVPHTTTIALIMSGSLAGLAGVMQLARQGGGVPTVGLNFGLPAIAATFLGAVVIKPGRPNVLGTLVGVLFVAVAVNGFIKAGLAPWVELVVNGAILITGVAVSALLGAHPNE